MRKRMKNGIKNRMLSKKIRNKTLFIGVVSLFMIMFGVGSVFAINSGNLHVAGTVEVNLPDGFMPPPIVTTTPQALSIPEQSINIDDVADYY